LDATSDGLDRRWDGVGDGAACPRALWLWCSSWQFAVLAKDRPMRSEAVATPLKAAGDRTWRVRSVVVRDGLA
jgi:hypothetical protein